MRSVVLRHGNLRITVIKGLEEMNFSRKRKEKHLNLTGRKLRRRCKLCISVVTRDTSFLIENDAERFADLRGPAIVE
jgi:hypothetical protein